MNDASTSPTVPPALRRWFLVHFLLDVAFAIPLLVAPRSFLLALGWRRVDPVASRLVAAALFGIGIESFLARNAPLSAFPALLNLKIIWSWGAVIGILISIIEGAHGVPWALAGFLFIFAAFNVVWTWWRRHVAVLLS
ncbi:MAG: hypothetical protein MI724_02075 [Spirochaetales bacterium]|nr:hypothetical protein [Spirochaetales bacterium]